jgi:hypothetical protein
VGLIMMPIPMNNIVTNTTNEITSRSNVGYLNLIRYIYNYIKNESIIAMGALICYYTLVTINEKHKTHYKLFCKSLIGIHEMINAFN